MTLRYYKRREPDSPQCLVCGKRGECHHILGGSYRAKIGKDRRGTIWLCRTHHLQLQGTTVDNIVECLAWKLLYDTMNYDPIYLLKIYRPRAGRDWVNGITRRIKKRARELARLEGFGIYNVRRVPANESVYLAHLVRRGRKAMRKYINMILDLVVEAWKNQPKDWRDKEAVAALFRQISDELAAIVVQIVSDRTAFGAQTWTEQDVEEEVLAAVEVAGVNIPSDVIAAIVKIIMWIISIIPK